MLKTRKEHHYWKRLIDSNLHSHLKFLFSKAAVHQRLAEQTLLTLAGFVDWVKFGTLYIKNCIILQMLCLLLEEDSLKIPSCECLLIIVSRKVITTIILVYLIMCSLFDGLTYNMHWCFASCVVFFRALRGKENASNNLLFSFFAFRF